MKFFTKFSLMLLMLLGLIYAGSASRTVWAHASYVRSDPPANTRFNAGQPPRQVQVWFSEELEPKFSELQVFNQKRQRADNGDSRVLSAELKSIVVTLPYNLPDDIYTVEYKVISTQDGHVIKNSFVFVVGTGTLPASGNEASETTEAGEDEGENFNLWSVGLRWLNYLSLALLLGGTAWWLWIWQPALHKVKLPAGPAEKLIAQLMEQRCNLLLSVGLVGLSLGWLGWLFYQGTRFGGVTLPELFSSSVLSEVLFNSRFGTIWLLRLVMLLITILIFFFMFRRGQARRSPLYTPTQAQTQIHLVVEAKTASSANSPSTSARFSYPNSDATDSFSTRHTSGENLPSYGSPHRYQRRGYWLLLLCGMQLAFSTLFNSHARTNPIWLLLPVHWLHLLAASVWIGGLVYLALALPPTLAALPPAGDSRARLKAALLIRFSKVAALSVVVLVTSGAIEALLHLRAVSDFFTTAYGSALFIKLLAVSLLLLLGAFNLFKVRSFWLPLAHRNKETMETGAKVKNRPSTHWWLSVKIEALLAVGLLAIVGGLTSFGPPVKGELIVTNAPVEQPGEWLVMSGQIADLNYILRLDPGKAGYNDFDLFLTRENKPLADQVEELVLRLSPDESGKSTSQEIKVEFSVVPDIPGYYLAHSQLLNSAGPWQAELSLKLKDFEEARTSLQIKVSP